MVKAMVVRAGSGWARALIKHFIGANVEVVAYSGSRRKLEARFEPIDEWQLRLLQWYEPRVKKMLDRYERPNDDNGTNGIEFYGQSPASYQESIASTVKHMARKLQGGLHLG